MTLSVAMCTYNGAEFITQQLESVLQQEIPVNEIIICDDGSSDNTIEVATDYLKHHAQCAYYVIKNEQNLRVIKNFEKAIRLCTGDIIFLSDQDDIWHMDKTRVIVSYFDNHPEHSVVFTDANLVGLNNEKLTERSLLDSVCLRPYLSLFYNGLQNEIFYTRNYATGATMAFRKSFVSTFMPFDNLPHCLHDEQIAIRAVQHNCLGVIEDRLIDYRQHGTNVIGVSSDNWVYTGGNPSNLLATISYCHEFKEPWYSDITPRIRFFQLRASRCNAIIGKIKMLGHIREYRHFYGNYWMVFLYADLRFNLRKAFHLPHNEE